MSINRVMTINYGISFAVQHNAGFNRNEVDLY